MLAYPCEWSLRGSSPCGVAKPTIALWLTKGAPRDGCFLVGSRIQFQVYYFIVVVIVPSSLAVITILPSHGVP